MIAVDRDASSGARTAAEIGAAGGLADFRELDVTDEEGCRRVAGEVLGTHGRLDILVNNAGIGHVGTALTTSGADLDRLFVSSASIELSDQMKNRFPHSGGLFELTGHGSRGFAPHPASLEAR